jgi:hypothetical protein
LAAGTNRYIGGHAPSHYLARIQNDKQIDAATLDRFLASHSIPVTQLRGDAFDEFIRLRANALLGLVEAATGKQISGRDSQETINAFGQALT